MYECMYVHVYVHPDAYTSAVCGELRSGEGLAGSTSTAYVCVYMCTYVCVWCDVNSFSNLLHGYMHGWATERGNGMLRQTIDLVCLL